MCIYLQEEWQKSQGKVNCISRKESFSQEEPSKWAKIAQRIQNEGLKGVAAIASRQAAKYFDLEIIADDIQTIEHNSTRFFILKKKINDHSIKQQGSSVKNKSSIKFITKHDTGSLAEVLDIFAKHEISLTKIQSLPKIDEPWKYAFFIDLIFDDRKLYENALHLINKKVTHLKILGEYQQNSKRKWLKSRIDWRV